MRIFAGNKPLPDAMPRNNGCHGTAGLTTRKQHHDAMLTTTRAIVLHSFKYGESKLIVELLTVSHGRMSCIATLSKSPRAGLKKQCFQPLFIVEAVIDVRQRARLQRIKEARVAVPYATIPFEPTKLAVAMFLAEFMRCATRGEPLDEPAFAYVENSLRWLDGCTGSTANFHLVFMMRMARFLGFYPNTDGYRPGCRFDLRASCFSTDAPMHADCLPPEESQRITMLLRMNYPTMHLYKMTRAERNRMADVILRYYQIHMPDFPELKSLAVLKELFAGD